MRKPESGGSAQSGENGVGRTAQAAVHGRMRQPRAATDAGRGMGGNIALSWEGAFGALSEMDATDAEQANARRVQRLLYGLMIVMIGVPLMIFVVRLF